MKTPDACATKEDVRAEIDRIDQGLLALLAERHSYVTRMAELKSHPDEAYDPARIETIISRMRARSSEISADPDQIELLWRTLIDWNVDYEKGIINQRIGG